MTTDVGLYINDVLQQFPVQGCDVSAWQNNIETPRTVDFKKMRSAGAQFCFMRVTYGLTADRDFPDYWRLAKGEGLKRSGYMFLLPQYSIDDQVNKFCDIMLKNGLGEIEPVIDVEKWTAGTPTADMVSMVRGTIMRRLGRLPIIYSGFYVWRDEVARSNNPIFKDNPLWIAAYDVEKPMIPPPWDDWLFWQFHIKNFGPEFGAESLDIDRDVCKLTQTQFNSRYGESPIVVTPPVTPEIPQGGNMLYDTNANGIMLWSAHKGVTAESLKRYDFVMSVAWDGKERNLEFANHIQAAYDAKKPFIAVVKPWLQDYPGIGASGTDPNQWKDHWPKFENDYNCVQLDKQFYMGGALRPNIHGVLLDMTGSLGNTGILPAGWLVYAAKYFIWAMSDRYKKTWWTLWQNDLVTIYSRDIDKQGMLPTFLTMTAQGGNDQGVSMKAFSRIVKNSRGLNVPEFAPVAPEKEGAHVPWSSKWYWWWFTTVLSPGITPSVSQFIYNGTPADLYEVLNFTGGTVTPPQPPPPPTGTKIPAEALADLDARLVTARKAWSAFWKLE